MADTTMGVDVEARAEALIRNALERLDSAQHELVLDFSAVRRLNAPAFRAIEELAAKARDRSVAIVIQDVNVEVYKVLKLTAIAGEFSFAD